MMGKVTRKGLGRLIRGNVLELHKGMKSSGYFPQWIPAVRIYFILFQTFCVKTAKKVPAEELGMPMTLI